VNDKSDVQLLRDYAERRDEAAFREIVIVVDGHLYSAPVIREEISEGKAQITGSFTEEEAQELAAKINDAIGSQ
jgi:preprotein translocase subunit SecD